MASNVSSVYIHVIDDVISKVRDEFISYGVGDAVLNELQALWEMKMLQCGAISGTIERAKNNTNANANAPSASAASGSIAAVHDLNVPYDGLPEEYATPTAEMLFPPTPQQTPIQTPLPGTDAGMYNIPTGPSDYAPSPISDVRNGLNGGDSKSGRPSPYMPPPSPWMSQRPLGVDVNVAYVEGREDPDRGAPSHAMTKDFLMMSSGKRKRDEYPGQHPSGPFVPQQDGSKDVALEISAPESQLDQLRDLVMRNKEGATTKKLCSKEASVAPVLPQRDGIQDDYNDFFHFPGIPAEDYNTPGDSAEYRAPTPAVATPKPRNDAEDDDEEPPLNEDDDDDDELDDLDEGEEEPTTQHLVLAQFDKVTRTKNRWKCTLKDGIMHLNGRDVLFNKATGEFDF